MDRLRSLGLLILLIGALGCLSACGSKGAGTSTEAAASKELQPAAPASPTEQPGYTASVRDGDTAIVVPADDPALGGVTVTVPAGSTPVGTEITLAADGESTARLAELVEGEPGLYAAISDLVAAQNDPALHPAYAPLLVAAEARPVGPSLRLGPDGATFDAPVVMTVPLPGDLATDENLFALVRSSDGSWEAAPVTVDESAGTLRLELAHFSTVKLFGVIWNAVTNPLLGASRLDLGAARKVLAGGPIGGVVDGLERTVTCADAAATVSDTLVPRSLPDLLNYLGRDVGEISDATVDHVPRLERFIAKASTGKHSVALSQLLGKALELSHGDVYQALVSVHATLSINRPYAEDTAEQKQKKRALHDALELVRGDGSAADEQGARYHLIGMAIYAFTREYLRDRDELSVLGAALPAGFVARIEESWISGDLLSDTVEYAVDLEGANLGRRLFDQYRARERGNPAPDDVCVRELTGTFDLPAQFAELKKLGSLSHNEITLNLYPRPGEPTSFGVEGTIDLEVVIPGSVLYAIAMGLGEAIGEAVGGAVAGGTSLGTAGSDGGGSTSSVDVPPEFERCSLSFFWRGPIERVKVRDGQLIGKVALAYGVRQEGCSDIEGFDPSALGSSGSELVELTGTYDGTAASGTLLVPSEGATAALAFTAQPSPR